jgi:hypothetical protein
MSIDSTQIMREVDEIKASGDSNSNWRIDLNLMVKEGQWLTPMRTDFYHLNRDYAGKQFADHRMVEVMYLMGDYQYDIVPNRDNLVMEVKYVPLKINTTSPDPTRQIETIRYRAVLITQQDMSLSGKSSQLKSREAMNQVGMIPVALQLIEESAYRVNMMSYGTTLRQCTTMMAMQSALAETLQNQKGAEHQRILGINTVDGFNTEIRKQINFPDGIMIKDIPAYLQNDEGGVYATGLGRYLQDQYWYIYPLYDTLRYRKNAKTLKVINVPNDRYQGAERTYKVRENDITVIATGDAKSLDKGLAQSLTQGNGLRFSDVTKFLGEFGVEKDNRTLVDRASNLFEVGTEVLQTGYNNIRWAVDRATSNPFKHYSEMAKRRGQFVKMEWWHGDTDLLYPGMPVKFMSVNGNLVEIYYGVLLGVDEQRKPADNSAKASRYPGIVTLAIFINRKDGEDVPKTDLGPTVT